MLDAPFTLVGERSIPIPRRAQPRKPPALRAGGGARRRLRTLVAQTMSDVSIFDAYEKVTGRVAPRSERRQVRVLCPFHADTSPSMDLHAQKNAFVCRACGKNGGIADLVIQAGLVGGTSIQQSRAAAFAWLREGPKPDKLLPQPPAVGKSVFKKLRHQRRSAFHYVDEHGERLYDVIRIDGINEEGEPDKDFFQRRRAQAGERIERWRTVDGKREKAIAIATGTEWVSSMVGARYVLYHLPRVLTVAAAHGTLVLAEGERKADLVTARTGIVATTFAGGARARLQASWLVSVMGVRRLAVFVDSDVPGREAGLERAAFFSRAIPDVRIVDFYPEANNGDDVEDWLNRHPRAGRREIEALIFTAPSFDDSAPAPASTMGAAHL